MSKETIEPVSHIPGRLVHLSWPCLGQVTSIDIQGYQPSEIKTQITLGELVMCLGLMERLALCNSLFQNLGSPQGRHLPVKKNTGAVGTSEAVPVRAAPGQIGKWVKSSFCAFFLAFPRSAASVGMLFSENLKSGGATLLASQWSLLTSTKSLGMGTPYR